MLVYPAGDDEELESRVETHGATIRRPLPRGERGERGRAPGRPLRGPRGRADDGNPPQVRRRRRRRDRRADAPRPATEDRLPGGAGRLMSEESALGYRHD